MPDPPRPGSPAVRVRGLRRSFPTFLGLRRLEVLHGIDLELAPGRTLALVGPNGSGKSTLLGLLSGVDSPTSGSVEVFGGDPARREVRRRLAFLPQDSPFPGELSAQATMELIGSLAGLDRATRRRRGAELLERVGLEARARSPLRSFSRGMLRRFGLAQVFLTDPELVLLDEPTAGLDAPGFGVFAQLCERAREAGATIVIASHLLEDLAPADELVVLIDGAVVSSGPPADVLARGQGLAEMLRVEGLDPERGAELSAWLEEQGARLVSRQPATRGLGDLYSELGAEDDPKR